MTDIAPGPRIVVLDGATVEGDGIDWRGIEGLGRLEVHARTPASLVVSRARGARVVLTNKTRLDAATIEALPGLGLISVLATGVDVVDLEAAREAGVTVSNVPEYSTASVVQHVFALLLERSSRVTEHARAVRAGDWSRCEDFTFRRGPLIELSGSTMGVVGFGRIGRAVAKVALAFGMRVVACRASALREPGFEGVEWCPLEEVFERSDVVTLHCPLTAATRGMVGEAQLSRMKPESILINTARGALVDEAALAAALAKGRPGAAALDVLSVEPPPSDHPLVASPGCLVTPHLAWSTPAARGRLLEVTAANVRGFLAGAPRNVVASPRTTASESPSALPPGARQRASRPHRGPRKEEGT